VSDVSRSIVPALREFYGPVHRAPANLFPFIVWEVLSEHAAPGRRDLAWTALRKIPALTPDAMFLAPVKELGEAVALSGAPREDALARLRAIVDTFKRQRDVLDDGALQRQSVLQAARALRVLTQVDTAVQRRALLYVTDHPVVPADDDLGRLVLRLTTAVDLSATARPLPSRARARLRRRARQWLTPGMPADRDACRDAFTYLRHHARQTCLAVGPHCAVCPLLGRCATGAAAGVQSTGPH
jgi:endonuclease III